MAENSRLRWVEPMGGDLLAWSKVGGAAISLHLLGESGSRTGDRFAVTISPAR